jgi:ferredoxin
MSEPSFSIDEDICAGHGRCYMLWPNLFEADDMGRGVVLTDIDPAAVPDDRQEIVSACPEGAITAL